MRFSIKQILVALCIGAVAPAPASLSFLTAAAQEANQRTITALSERAERDTARLVRAVRQSGDPALKPDSETGKPLWASLKDLNAAVLKMSNGAALQDDSFHEGLAETVRNTAALFAVFTLTESKDENVSKALDAVEAVVATLEESFSKPATRARKGGELTEQERKKLDEVKAKQAELDNRLKAIEPKVAKNAKAKAAIAEIRRRSYWVRDARYTAGDFAASLLALSVIDGLLWGAHWWWGPWGVWVPTFGSDYAALYDTALDDIAYDWAVEGVLEADIGALGAEALSGEIDLEAVGAGLDDVDVDMADGLSGTEVEGLEAVSELDLTNEVFGLENFSFSPEIGDLGETLDDGVDALVGIETDISTGQFVDDLNDTAVDVQLEDSLGSTGSIALDMGNTVGDSLDAVGELGLEDGPSLGNVGGLDFTPDAGTDFGGPLDLGGDAGFGGGADLADMADGGGDLDLGGGADIGGQLDLGGGGGIDGGFDGGLDGGFDGGLDGGFDGFDDMGMDDLGGFDDF